MVKTASKNRLECASTPTRRTMHYSNWLMFVIFSVLVFGILIAQTALAQPKYVLSEDAEGQRAEFRKELDKWLLQAYEGDQEAQFKIGVLFSNNEIGQPDYEQSVYWYKQAARQGHILAQYNLGHQYLMGLGVQRNEVEAMRWWREAAKQNHALASFNIGRAYYLGIGLPEDHSLSRYWFERAAMIGEPKSIEILEQLGWSEKGKYESKATDLATLAQQDAAITPTAPGLQDEPNAGVDPNAGLNKTSEAVDTPSAQGLSNQVSTEVVTEPESELESVSAPITGSASGSQAPDLSDPSQPETNQPRVESASIEPNQDSTTEKTTPAKIAEPIAIQTPQPIKPLALYTDPSIRSVLITMTEEIDNLSVDSQNETWSVVSDENGLPVWVYKDFIEVNGTRGEIKGKRVNARSVPIIARGTIVGRFDDGETTQVLDQRDDWFRVRGPQRFKAWVKTKEYQNSLGPVKAKQNNSIASNREPKFSNLSENDNDWLYSQPAQHYTLQLASFDDPQKVAEFLSREKFRNNPNLRRFTSTNNGIRWTYFLYGSYSNQEQAREARTQIGQRLAWVRQFDRLQQSRCVAWKKQIPSPAELNRYCRN